MFNMAASWTKVLWLVCLATLTRGQLVDDLDQMSSDMKQIEQQLGTLETALDNYNRQYDDLDDRVTNLQGEDCPDPLFSYQCRQAGTKTGQCVPSYLVCDGSADCPSGDDEKSCNTVREVLSDDTVLDTVILYDNCGSTYDFRTAKMVLMMRSITDDTISNDVNLVLDGDMQFGQEYRTSPTWTGVWLPASQTIFWEGASAGGIDIIWKFNRITRKTFPAYSVRRLTGEMCGHFVYTER